MATNPPAHDPFAGSGGGAAPAPRYTGRPRVPGPGASVGPVEDGPAGRSPYARADPQPPAPAPAPRGTATPPGRRVKPRWGRIALVLTLVFAVVAGCGALVGYVWMQ